MIEIRENVPLAPLTTLRVGGAARFFAEVRSEEDVEAALGEAKRGGLRVAVLGNGSNVLVSDEGVDGFVLHNAIPGLEIVKEGDETFLIAGAGVAWDEAVDFACAAGLWGIENLAGIPSTAGAAAVQNIGAYGADIARTFVWADAMSRTSGDKVRVSAKDAAQSYRDSAFKRSGAFVITRIALRLARAASPLLSYKGLASLRERATAELTPAVVAAAVRKIRIEKFPKINGEGTAGSFFKNPFLSSRDYHALKTRFPELPGVQTNTGIKIPLAWLLDRALGLSGFARGGARLYEGHPIILVTSRGARAADVDALARIVVARVKTEFNIHIEREVQLFVAR